MVKSEAWAIIPITENGDVVLDMQPIVLCKNCKYYDAKAEWLKCKAHHAPESQNWFCADGERKDDNDN